MVHCLHRHQAEIEQCGEYDDSPHPSAPISLLIALAKALPALTNGAPGTPLPESFCRALIRVKRRSNNPRMMLVRKHDVLS